MDASAHQLVLVVIVKTMQVILLEKNFQLHSNRKNNNQLWFQAPSVGVISQSVDYDIANASKPGCLVRQNVAVNPAKMEKSMTINLHLLILMEGSYKVQNLNYKLRKS